MRELYNRGYSLVTVDVSGQTALHHAARLGHKEIVRFILEFAPQSLVNVKDNAQGQTALHKAAMHSCRSICCMLVAAGAELDATDNRGLTPRLLAVQVDDQELAAYFESTYT